tara:strand:- start:150 stop:1505 length:1356 start_codon:yes stop_codon:yes gene_type:complete
MEGFNRRQAIMGLATLVGGTAGMAPAISWGAEVKTAPKFDLSKAGRSMDDHFERNWWQLGIMGDAIMDNQLLWYLGQVGQRSSEVSECLDVAHRIDIHTDDSWFTQWNALAERVETVAETSYKRGHLLSSGQAYLRAANYYRAALIHFLEEDGPRLKKATLASRNAYEKALKLLKVPGVPVDIPYEGTTLPAHFYTSPVADKKAPVLIMHQGMHAWPEETKWAWEGAIMRGYHVLAFHGPGQGIPLRLQNLKFRPDWENVVKPVVDVALQMPGVDPNRVILKGLSFGGYLAPRAAAFEKRLAVCIANPGVLSWFDGMEKVLTPDFVGLAFADPEQFNSIVEQTMMNEPGPRWGLADGMWKFGATSPAEFIHKLKEYTTEPYVDQIKCKVLVMDGAAEEFSKGQGPRLYEALNTEKEYMLFDAEDTGLVHCQTGALAIAEQRMFDWLDEQML